MRCRGCSMDISTHRPVPYDTDLQVVTAWNGAGTPIVFGSKETCEQLLEMYEAFRAEVNFPWVYERGAINGDKVLDLFYQGLRPWKVYLSDDLKIKNVKPIPLHHVTLKIVTERYGSGAPRSLEIWSATRESARDHVNTMLDTKDRTKLLLGVDAEWVAGYEAPAKEVNFYTEEQIDRIEELTKAEHYAVKPTPPPAAPPMVIPGFGSVLDLSQL